MKHKKLREYNKFKTLSACLYTVCRLKTVMPNPNDKLFHVSALFSVETEEAALLHEEATMTIEELLVRYGQNRNAVKHAAAIRYSNGVLLPLQYI